MKYLKSNLTTSGYRQSGPNGQIQCFETTNDDQTNINAMNSRNLLLIQKID